MNIKTATRLTTKMLLILTLGAGLGLVSACQKQGPMEEMGENMDNSVESMSDNMSEAKEEVKDEMDDHTTK